MSAARPALVFCGPSGVGKSTILKYLFDKHPETFKFSVSHTTRQPRTGELDGREYHFVTHEHFDSMIKEEKFIEYTKFASNSYGTSKQTIQDIQKEGKWCVLDLDWQGVLSVRRLKLNARVVFIRPPSVEALRSRLSGRGTESAESMQQRLEAAEEDMRKQEKDEALCDLILINDDIERACKQVEEFIFNPNL